MSVLHFMADWAPQCEQMNDVIKELCKLPEIKVCIKCNIMYEFLLNGGFYFSLAFMNWHILWHVLDNSLNFDNISCIYYRVSSFWSVFNDFIHNISRKYSIFKVYEFPKSLYENSSLVIVTVINSYFFVPYRCPNPLTLLSCNLKLLSMMH